MTRQSALLTLHWLDCRSPSAAKEALMDSVTTHVLPTDVVYRQEIFVAQVTRRDGALTATVQVTSLSAPKGALTGHRHSAFIFAFVWAALRCLFSQSSSLCFMCNFGQPWSLSRRSHRPDLRNSSQQRLGSMNDGFPSPPDRPLRPGRGAGDEGLDGGFSLTWSH